MNRFPKYLIAIIIFFFCSGCFFWGSSYIQPGQLFGDKELFSGFSILNVPREDISLGSRWQQGLGPSDKGLPESDLMVIASLKEADFSRADGLKIRAGIIASLNRLYSLELEGGIYDLEILSLEDANIIRVADLNSLKLVSGGYYVWEGIRLKNITIRTQRDYALNLVGKLKNIFPAASISIEAGNQGKAFLEIKGVNLFVAYRIVGFKVQPPVKLDSFRLTKSNIAKNIGGEYLMEFIPAVHPTNSQGNKLSEEDNSEKKESCFFQMIVTSYNRLDQEGQPLQNKWDLGCKGRLDTGRYELGYLEAQNGILLDEIIINQTPPDFSKIMNQFLINPFSMANQDIGSWDFVLQRRLFETKILEFPSAPGWKNSE